MRPTFAETSLSNRADQRHSESGRATDDQLPQATKRPIVSGGARHRCDPQPAPRAVDWWALPTGLQQAPPTQRVPEAKLRQRRRPKEGNLSVPKTLRAAV